MQRVARRHPAAPLHPSYANQPKGEIADPAIDAAIEQAARYDGRRDVVPNGRFFSLAFNMAEEADAPPPPPAPSGQTMRPPDQAAGFLPPQAHVRTWHAAYGPDTETSGAVDRSRDAQLYVDPFTAPKDDRPMLALEGRVVRVGYLEAVTDSTLTARVSGLRAGAPQWRANFPLEAVSDGDRDLARPGTRLLWSVGYRCEDDGTRIGVSRLTLIRQPPAWQPEQLRLAQARDRVRPAIRRPAPDA